MYGYRIGQTDTQRELLTHIPNFYSSTKIYYKLITIFIVTIPAEKIMYMPVFCLALGPPLISMRYDLLEPLNPFLCLSYWP